MADYRGCNNVNLIRLGAIAGSKKVNADPLATFVVFLANFETDFTDLKGATPTVIGGASVSGGWLNVSNQSGVWYPQSDLYGFGTGDFTVESEVQLANVPFGRYLIGTTNTATGPDFPKASGWAMRPAAGGGVDFVLATTAQGNTGGTLPSNTTKHIAMSRQSGIVRTFIDGVKQQVTGISRPDNVPNPTRPLVIGRDGYFPDEATFEGKIRRVRITKGVARYWENFTPPSGPLSL